MKTKEELIKSTVQQLPWMNKKAFTHREEREYFFDLIVK